MRTKHVYFKMLVVLILLSLSGLASATCRDLVKGEPYYGSWKSCCDVAGSKSAWVSRSGSGRSQMYNGSCAYWGIKDVAPVKNPICRKLRQGEPYYRGWARCCDDGKGGSLWNRRLSDLSEGQPVAYRGDCRSWGIK